MGTRIDKRSAKRGRTRDGNLFIGKRREFTKEEKEKNDVRLKLREEGAQKRRTN